MKQVLQNLRSGETIVADVPIPSPSPGTALVHTAASLVSVGTERMLVEFAERSLFAKARSRPDLVRQALDKARREGLLTALETSLNRLDQPIPLGYSSAGTIVAVGGGVQDFRVGQRVACAGGGYAVHAEYALIPKNLLTPLPDEVDFESAAFTTLGAIALHGFRLSKPQLGERLVVIGLGLLGLLTMNIARAAGCHALGVDLDSQRVTYAVDLGFKAVHRDLAVEAGQCFSQGRGCDAVLICADTPSADPVELAGVLARDRARLVAIGAVGLKLPRKIYYEKELSFINSRSYGPGRYDPVYEEAGIDYPIGYVRWTQGRNFDAFVDLLAAGRVDVLPLISHRFPIDQAPYAYQLITGKHPEPFLGVLLTYKETLDSNHSPEIILSTPTRQPRTTAAAPPVGLGLLGAGNFATTVMLPAIRKVPIIDLVGVVSATGVSAHHVMKRFGFHYAASQDAQLLDDPQINVVAILTPHHLHAQQVLVALENNKHVFCEKPLAIRPEELDDIAQSLASNPTSLLMVGFNRRFAPLAQQLHQFLGQRAEPLMVHYRVNAGYLPLNHWLHDPLIGGGRIIGEGCHFIDFITFLVGDPPTSVSAQALPDIGRYREDNTILTLSFPDGSLGTVSYLANGDRRLPKERVEVFCAGRVAVLDDFRSMDLISNGQRTTIRSHFRQDKGHRAEWESFCKAIINGGPPPIPYDHLIGVTQTSLSAVQSLRSGDPVRIIPPRIPPDTDN